MEKSGGMETFRITFNRETITVPIDVSINYVRRRFGVAEIIGLLLPNGVEFDLESNHRAPLASLDTVLLAEENSRQEDRSIRKVKIFVSTGYQDGSGDPKQARTTSTVVERECNTWMLEQRNNIKVIDVQVSIDSKQHGNSNWNGGCVSSIVVHYYDRRE